MNRKWLTLGLAFSTGVAMGVAASWTWLEGRATDQYRTWVATRVATENHVRAMRNKREEQWATPETYIKAKMKEDLATLQENITPYEAPHEVLNPSEFELISEAEFYNNITYDKIAIEIFKNDGLMQLVVDGEAVLDWMDYLHPGVFDEMAGNDKGIFLRNNLKSEDYEVTWGKP